MRVILFEDELVGRLRPAALGRPAFAIACGGYRLIDLISPWDLPLTALVRPHLRDVLGDYLPGESNALSGESSPVQAGDPSQHVLLVNARLVPAISVTARLQKALRTGRPGLVRTGGALAAGIIPLYELENRNLKLESLSGEQIGDLVNSLPLPSLPIELPLLDWPHDIIRWHLECIGENLQHRISSGEYQQTSDGLFVAPGVQLGEHLVVDAQRGPVVLEAGVRTGPFCYLRGPVHVGPRSVLIEHASLKDGVALGQTCKVGGEIEASIIEPFSNKQHHGFLGHSYIGSWVNLGAGTSTSDLKNTYGTVNMLYAGERVASGMQLLGSIVGDYAKTAINTSLFTGKTIGVASMVYGVAASNVPSFVNYARSLGQVTGASVEVMIETQARMFARRGVSQRPCDIELLRAMYALTQDERDALGEPLPNRPLSF